jgi:hypothetical protein
LKLKLLRDRISELRRYLLPTEFSATGLYDNEELVRVHALAFRVLAHAEFESYLEDCAVEIAKKALERWQGERLLSHSLLHLLAFSGQEMLIPPATLIAPKKEKEKRWSEYISIEQKISDCVSNYVRRISRENHGIKEKNVLQIILPIGIQSDKIDPILIEELNSFGEARGEAAHLSIAHQSKSAVDPKTEFERVQRILIGMNEIDAIFQGIIADLLPIEEIICSR